MKKALKASIVYKKNRKVAFSKKLFGLQKMSGTTYEKRFTTFDALMNLLSFLEQYN